MAGSIDPGSLGFWLDGAARITAWYQTQIDAFHAAKLLTSARSDLGEKRTFAPDFRANGIATSRRARIDFRIAGPLSQA
jgi:hypothetical protein